MAHELVGDRFVARETPGWHRIGRTAKKGEQATASEWVEEVTKDAEVVKLPMTYWLDGKEYKSNQVAIVRKPMKDDDVPRQFGIASDSWKLESYVACAKVFDKLSETYPVETAGLIKHGAICFVSFKAEEWNVLGDQVISYITVAISMKPGISHHVLHTPVRTVCNNTLSMAISSANINIKIPHEADSLEQMKLAADIVKQFHEAKNKTKELCEALARKTLTVDEAEEIFLAAYPDPAMPRKLRILYEQFPTEEERTVYTKGLDADQMATIKLAELRHQQLMGRAESLRELARECYAKFDREDMRGTAWAAYNAVTENSDWREGSNADESLLFGSRAKEKARAFDAAVALAGK
jgi:hypothetical protein